MTVTGDGQDDAIEAFDEGEVGARGRIAAVEAERNIYRTMVQILLARAHNDGVIMKRQRETTRRDREERRRLRQQVRRTEGAAHDGDE